MSGSDTQHRLTRFILEIRKQDGSVFTPNSLQHITAGLRHHYWNGRLEIDLYQNSDFSEFHASLDSEVKRPQQQGIGATRRQANVLTETDEELLWSKYLGDSAPHSLLDTMVFIMVSFSP